MPPHPSQNFHPKGIQFLYPATTTKYLQNGKAVSHAELLTDYLLQLQSQERKRTDQRHFSKLWNENTMETSLEINGQYENKIFFVKNRSVKYLISLFFFFLSQLSFEVQQNIYLRKYLKQSKSLTLREYSRTIRQPKT